MEHKKKLTSRYQIGENAMKFLVFGDAGKTGSSSFLEPGFVMAKRRHWALWAEATLPRTR
jgi:hypothetical protein